MEKDRERNRAVASARKALTDRHDADTGWLIDFLSSERCPNESERCPNEDAAGCYR